MHWIGHQAEGYESVKGGEHGREGTKQDEEECIIHVKLHLTFLSRKNERERR